MGVFSSYFVMSGIAFLLLLSSNVVLFHSAGAAGLPSPPFELSPEHLSPGLSPRYLSPGYLSPGHLTPGHLTPGYLTPGYLTPGYLRPNFPRRPRATCRAGRRRPKARDGQPCILRCLYRTCPYGKCKDGECVRK